MATTRFLPVGRDSPASPGEPFNLTPHTTPVNPSTSPAFPSSHRTSVRRKHQHTNRLHQPMSSAIRTVYPPPPPQPSVPTTAVYSNPLTPRRQPLSPICFPAVSRGANYTRGRREGEPRSGASSAEAP